MNFLGSGSFPELLHKRNSGKLAGRPTNVITTILPTKPLVIKDLMPNTPSFEENKKVLDAQNFNLFLFAGKLTYNFHYSLELN